MIQSKKDYLEYLQKDLEVQMVKPLKAIRPRLNRLLIEPNETLEFTKLLRKVEYYQNCKHSALSKLYYYYLKRKLHKKQVLLGFYINPNCFGPIIADGIVIGANSVVNKSFTEENITIAGVPAKKINNKGRKDLFIE